MPINVDKAFEFAQESTKQILTLSTAILTLTISFQKDIVGSVAPADRWALKCAWVAYLVSIVCGLFTLMNLAGNLEKPGGGGEPTIYRGSIMTFSILQVISFGLGTGFTLWFGLIAF